MSYGYDLGIGIIHILWIILLIVVIVGLIHWIFGPGRHDRRRHFAHRSEALELLKERFARGEINKEEYEERKKVLEL